MSYNVQVGTGGYTGWKILERTMERQRDVFSQNYAVRSYKDYFSNKFPEVATAEQLVADYKLLTVALRAFGLESDINNRFFIRKILESDPDDSTSLVNRLADKRYLKLNQALAFHDTPDERENKLEPLSIIEKFETRSFEKNIGERYTEIELALNAQREIAEIADLNISENAKWYQILASKPLRRIFEGAFGLGSSFASLPIDRQLSDMKHRTERLTGSDSVSQFSSSVALDSVLKRFLLLGQLNISSANTRYTTALAILKS